MILLIKAIFYFSINLCNRQDPFCQSIKNLLVVLFAFREILNIDFFQTKDEPKFISRHESILIYVLVICTKVLLKGFCILALEEYLKEMLRVKKAQLCRFHLDHDYNMEVTQSKVNRVTHPYSSNQQEKYDQF